MMRFPTPLPIDDLLPALAESLAARSNAVLEAPPGAGKTTRVPLALLEAPWMHGRRLVMLEPRRLAARAAAQFMARTLGEPVGGTVGYRVRGDTRVGDRTRIEVVTEGVLARLRSADPALEEYGAVLFDEFHERSVHADIGLALVLETQQLLRPDLRVVVMSATLDGDAVAPLLDAGDGAAPVLRASGRSFPVETRHRPPRSTERLEATVARVVREALRDETGDVLVFLPGAGEQRRVAELLGAPGTPEAPVQLHVLHGSLPLAAQDAAIAPAVPPARKVVLATSIAETSLTIEGVRVVVDCGLARLPRHVPRSGLTRLETVRVSRASADQRRGRAGRVAPGVCYRLWDVYEDAALAPRTRPEILEAELSSLALDLADAGVRDPADLRWVDAPPAGAYARAVELLVQLGALDDAGRITPHGRRMAALPLQPRLAHLVLVAVARGQGRLGALIAALLEERDVLRGDGGPPPADLRLRVDAVGRGEGWVPGAVQVDRDVARRVREQADALHGRLASARAPAATATLREDGHADDEAVGALLALAYPERVAQRRAGGDLRYLLRNGTGATLQRGDPLAGAEWLAIAELDGAPPEYRVARAAPLTRADLDDDFGAQMTREEMVEWDAAADLVRARRRLRLGALVVEDAPWRDADPALVADVLLREIGRRGIDALPWSTGAVRLRERLSFLHHHEPTWPDVSATALLADADRWLRPHLAEVRRWSDLERVEWHDALLSRCGWEQRAALDRLAPTHVTVPSGSRIAIDYGVPDAPVLAVKLQECFGWTDTPRVLDGRVPLTLHLLSPAQRPVQVTRDLAGFWRSSYFEVRKELRGRYPRHPWPEDPLSAEPTRRAKPRGT
jgi:ATP-dependent helicase HrpB